MSSGTRYREPTPREWELAREIKRALMNELGLTAQQGHLAMNIALLELVRFNERFGTSLTLRQRARRATTSKTSAHSR